MTDPCFAGVAAPSVIRAETATKGIIYSSTPLEYKAGPSRRLFGEVARTQPAPANAKDIGWVAKCNCCRPKIWHRPWKNFFRLPIGDWSVRWVIELKARTAVRMQWIFTSGRCWVLWGLFGFMQLCASKNLIYPPATLRFVWQLPKIMRCIGMRLGLCRHVPVLYRAVPGSALREFSVKLPGKKLLCYGLQLPFVS